jgi:hypothetical protein
MSAIKYIDHPKFPASAPPGHSHILDPSSATSGVLICDAVTTFLYHLDKRHPIFGLLDAFYDQKSCREVKVIRKMGHLSARPWDDRMLIIERMHGFVIVSLMH